MNQLYNIAGIIIGIYRVLIIARVLISFVPHNPHQPIFRFIYSVTEPILAPFRKLTQPLMKNIPIDVSPIFAFLLLDFIQRAIFAGY